MADNANGLVGYRENPHTDARDMAVLSARLLARSLKDGVLPGMAARIAPIIWPPTGTGTADRPMRDLNALARQIERDDPDIWAVNVVGGYAFSDVPDAGVAFSVITTGTSARAEAALDRLEALAISLRELGLPQEWDLDAALTEIKQRPGGPFIIVEPSDNIGGGAPGDDTAVLRGLLRSTVSPTLRSPLPTLPRYRRSPGQSRASGGRSVSAARAASLAPGRWRPKSPS
jgi:microcystin degradation protein MlrC